MIQPDELFVRRRSFHNYQHGAHPMGSARLLPIIKKQAENKRKTWQDMTT